MCVLRNVFPLNYLLYPPVTTFNNSGNPLLTTIQSTKHIKLWIPPRIGKNICYSIGVYQVSWVAVLSKSWFLVFMILLAGFFGLCSSKVHGRKHCVRVRWIHIDQVQICYMRIWWRSLTRHPSKIGIKYVEPCTLGSIIDEYYQMGVNVKIYALSS